VDRLREDRLIKTSVITDLEAIGPSVPLTPLVREYVEGLSRVHEEFRRSIDGDIPGWEGSLEWVCDHYAKMCPSDRGALVEIVAVNDLGQPTDREHIFSELAKQRKHLARKNSVLINLSKRFVSGSCDFP
jgi:hypothetical protein